ncbi:hypothetical protein PAAG_12135 [Paracoccidioides lutzii Pb01]|uniref:Uncharacterized protein n=1 Tax=Paracoccidioides lutzii (strain ATCC MYA-826 / Pb01) TaxID=502779 RepID=A0A0A2V508_PARBA|nr:hypothetical protein PAAG_12135 [Paracoccidioides lutzii Pb01]KGQ01190.1 hypothetical protein PAAG_12135 [Paracoccidioides lutzii Pb01]
MAGHLKVLGKEFGTSQYSVDHKVLGFNPPMDGPSVQEGTVRSPNPDSGYPHPV